MQNAGKMRNSLSDPKDAMAGDRLNQTSLWFSVDKIRGAIDRIRQQRAFGAEIEDGHLAELDEMAQRITTISNRYDPVPRT